MNLSEGILEDLDVDDGAVLSEIFAQFIGRRLPAESAHEQFVVRLIAARGRRTARRTVAVQRHRRYRVAGSAPRFGRHGNRPRPHHAPIGRRNVAAVVHSRSDRFRRFFFVVV